MPLTSAARSPAAEWRSTRSTPRAFACSAVAFGLDAAAAKSEPLRVVDASGADATIATRSGSAATSPSAPRKRSGVLNRATPLSETPPSAAAVFRAPATSTRAVGAPAPTGATNADRAADGDDERAAPAPPVAAAGRRPRRPG